MFPRYSWNINQSASLSGPLHVSLAVLVVNVPEAVRHSKNPSNRRKYEQGSQIKHQHVPFSSCASVVPVLGTTLALQILVGDQVVRHMRCVLTDSQLNVERRIQRRVVGQMRALPSLLEYHHHVEGHERRRFRLELQFPRRSTSADK
jgi:hypothetical protein